MVVVPSFAQRANRKQLVLVIGVKGKMHSRGTVPIAIQR
jgi:hypothetical protein